MREVRALREKVCIGSNFILFSAATYQSSPWAPGRNTNLEEEL